MANSPKAQRLSLEPLKVTCTSSDCDNELHCFRATTKMKAANEVGACRACGAKLVDWNRVHKKDVADVQYTLEALKYEMIRHHFCDLPYGRRGAGSLGVAIVQRQCRPDEKADNRDAEAEQPAQSAQVEPAAS